MIIDIIRVRNALSNEAEVEADNTKFLKSLFLGTEIRIGTNDKQDFSLLLIETGGTEEKFVKLLPSLKKNIYLLTNGNNNSLAASLEILTYLQRMNYSGEVIHGDVLTVRNKIISISKKQKQDSRKIEKLGVVGKPSNWLIASDVNREALLQKFSVELVDISMDEFKEEIDKNQYTDNKYTLELKGKAFNKRVLEKALQIYGALKRIIVKYELVGLTVRCFDLLSIYKNTSCLALAILNSEGYVATCEGDTTTMITMYVVRKELGLASFQANPSRIDVENKTAVFAHCTLPLSMTNEYCLNTHFESDLGVAVKGEMKIGDITLLKLNSELSELFIVEGVIIKNLASSQLCRTQIEMRFDEDISKLLTKPNGNHHVVVYGRHKEKLIKI